MFYCESCATTRQWPVHVASVNRRCECCEHIMPCYEHNSKELPTPPYVGKEIFVDIGKRYVKKMPYSEACMSMKIEDKIMHFEVKPNNMVQLYQNNQPFSSSITLGEAGLFTLGKRIYFLFGL